MPTPISPTATHALDINNPSDLEAQLLRLKAQQDSQRSSNNSSASPQSRKSSTVPLQTDQNQSTHKPRKTLSAYLATPLPDTKFLYTQFLFLSLATGILDATTFTTYSVFVTKQTGNTIFLALAALENGSVYQTEPNVAVSISLFFAGAVIFGHLGHLLGDRRRIWLLLSSLLQTSFVLAAAALRFWGGGHRRGSSALGVIALLSFGMGGQIAMSFSAAVKDVNTTMVTGAIVQVATDRNVFGKKNGARTRRVLFFFAMLGGGFLGAVGVRFEDPCLGIFVAGVVKGVVGLGFLV